MEQSALTFSFPLRSAFLALPLEGEAKERFRAVQSLLEPFAELFHFQAADRPHLTLIYWPSLMEIEYTQLLRQAEKIAARTHPFTLEVTGAETFEGDPLPRVLFLTIARSAALADLKKRCPWPNTKPFSPHITIARMKNPNAFRVHQKKILKALKDVAFEIPCDRLRLSAEIEGIRQMPLQDFLFANDMH